MKSHRRYDVAALLLLCSMGAASAAGGSASRPSDLLFLSGAQEQLIWQRVGRHHAGATTALPGFDDGIGATMPASVKARAIPSNVTAEIPAVRAYRYAMLGNELLIVNPTDKKIVDVISH